MEPLLESQTKLDEMGTRLLAIGLAVKEPGEQGLATDAAIVAIQDGRLGSDNLSTAMEELLPSGIIIPPRWAKSLAKVAQRSSVHQLVVQQALQTAFRCPNKSLPKNAASLLQLLHDLSLQLDWYCDDVVCRQRLEQIKGSGKAAKLAKAILSFPEADGASAQIMAAQQEALRHRLERLKMLWPELTQ